MLEFLTAPENLPFAVALILMLMIGAVEALGLGASAVHLELDIDAHAEGPDVLGWLGIGRVPLLMLLVVLLAWFGIVGMAGQQAAVAFLGAPLSPWLAAVVAFIAALPLTGLTAGGLARFMPHDETTAVSRDNLIGKRATVTVGSAARGSPARASVRDVHGQVHYVMLEPSEDSTSIPEGETALLVRREGDIFIGLYEAGPLRISR
jgi:hypothetical protein